MEKRIQDIIKSGDIDSRGMFRCWFPDAGADIEGVADQVRTVYNSGFGGMEIAMVSQFVDFDAAEYGWGTPRWKEIVRTILKTSLSLPRPLKIDFTITAHWPPALNTISPNDPAAQKELSFACARVSQSGVMPLPMPQMRTNDNDAGDAADYLFLDTFIAATTAKIAGKKGKRYILDLSSLRDVSEFVSPMTDDKSNPVFRPAGIPVHETKFGDKPKLADRQPYYKIDQTAAELLPSEGEEWKEGDTVLFAYFMRGTGQTLSGREMPAFGLQLPMADKMYATDYYSTEGTDAIIDFWNENILDDGEIVEMMKKTGGAIFEDSIESTCSTSVWTNRFIDEFKAARGYDIVPYMPFIQSLKGSDKRFILPDRRERGVIEDYYLTLSELYMRDHILRLQDWTKTFGYNYRAQSYGGCADTSAASCILDIAEGESLGFGEYHDYFRNIAGGVHMTGRKFVSDEVLADIMSAYALTWESSAATLNRNWAAGVGRMVIHGMSYKSEVSGKFSHWPGWHAFGNMFADPWGSRQTYWQEIDKFAAFISNTQAVLQNGVPRVDVCIYKNQRDYGIGFKELLDAGYNYDIISSSHLMLDQAVVENGRLCPDGPNYGALIINNQSSMPTDVARRVLEMAEGGLPVLFYAAIPERASGSSGDDTALHETISSLMKLKNVNFVDDSSKLNVVLKKLGVTPMVSYRESGLMPVCRQDGDDFWYFIYNDNDQNISGEVSFDRDGAPFELERWSGGLVPLASYDKSCGKTTVHVELCPKQARIFALLNVPESKHLPLKTGRTFLREGEIYVKTVTDVCNIKSANTKIESWGPADHTENPENFKNPEDSLKTTIDFGTLPLCTWNDIPATPEQLETLGVETMQQISGRGTYTAGFKLPECDGAFLRLEVSCAVVSSVRVNGTDAGSIDQQSRILDLGGLVQEGQNEVEITIATPLINRLRQCNPQFMGGGALPMPPEGIAPPEPDEDDDYEPRGASAMPANPEKPDEYHFGLTGISVIAYSERKV